MREEKTHMSGEGSEETQQKRGVEGGDRELRVKKREREIDRERKRQKATNMYYI